MAKSGLRMIPVYYNLSLILILLAIVSIRYDNIVLINIFGELWEHGVRATTKSNRARNTSLQMIRNVVSKPKI